MTTEVFTEKQVLIPIADESCGLEIISVAAALRRTGAQVYLAKVPNPNENCKSSLSCTTQEGITLQANGRISDESHLKWDMIVLPGGQEGSEIMAQSNELLTLLTHQNAEKKFIAAIGASPALVLAPIEGLLSPGATAIPQKKIFSQMNDPKHEYDVVVQDNIITSQGFGSSLFFAIQIVELLYGDEEADIVAKKMLIDRYGVMGIRYYGTKLEGHGLGVNEPEIKHEMKKILKKSSKHHSSHEPKKGQKSNIQALGKVVQPRLVEKSSKKKKDPNRPNRPKRRTSVKVFDNIVWPKLQNLDWKLNFGNRPNDRYYISPNDSNGIRFRSRIEVLNYLEKISNGNDDAAHIVKLYEDGVNAERKEKLEGNMHTGKREDQSKETVGRDTTNSIATNNNERKLNMKRKRTRINYAEDDYNDEEKKCVETNDREQVKARECKNCVEWNPAGHFSNGNDDETSSPTRKKRKPITNGAAWTDEENLRMYKAMQEKDHNWRSVAEAVGNRSQTSVEQHVRSTNYKNFVQNTIRMLKQTKTSGKKIAKKFVGSHVQMEESTFNESSRIMKEWSISDDKNEPRAMKSMSLSSVDKSQDDSLSEFDTDESLGRNYNECLPEGNGQNSPSNSETKYRELKTVKTEPANSDDGKTNDTDEEDRESGFSETGQSKIIEKNLDREGKHYHLCSSQSVIEASIKVENEAVSDRLQDIEQAVNSKAYI